METTQEAYAAGKRLEPFSEFDVSPLRFNIAEVVAAVIDWKQAQLKHEHTSYWGVGHIRIMRAYWLGVLRTLRVVDRLHKTDIQILEEVRGL